MKRVRVSLYFDLAMTSDYLLFEQLEGWLAGYPVQLELHPIHSNHLLALHGETTRDQEAPAARYERQAQARWARRHGVELRRPGQAVFGGQALRALLWTLERNAEGALAVALAAGRRVWRDGRGLEAEWLQAQINALELSGEEAIQFAESAEGFRALEQNTERAAQVGVFATPTLRVEETLYVGYEALEQVSEAALRVALAQVSPERLVEHVAQALVTSDEAQRGRTLARLLDEEEAAQPVAAPQPVSGTIEGLLPLLDALPDQPLKPRAQAQRGTHFEPDAALVRLLRLEHDIGIERLPEALVGRTGAAGVVMGPGSAIAPPRMESLSGALSGALGWVPGGGLMVGARTQRGREMFYLPPHAEVEQARFLPMVADGAPRLIELHTFRVASFSGALAGDGAAHRCAAALGAHMIVLIGLDPGDPRPMASAVRCGCWVLALSRQGARLCDAAGRFEETGWSTLGSEGALLELPWPARLKEGRGQTWSAEAPRKILIHDEPLVLGGANSGADLSLSVRSAYDLQIETRHAKSSISANRSSGELVRAPQGAVAVVPLAGERVGAAELIMPRVLRTLGRNAASARMLLVNYWSDAAALPGQLDLLLAATAMEQDLPVVLVVGDRPRALWQPQLEQHSAHRVEQEGGWFTVDLARQRSAVQHEQALLARLRPSPWRYIQMLRETVQAVGQAR